MTLSLLCRYLLLLALLDATHQENHKGQVTINNNFSTTLTTTCKKSGHIIGKSTIPGKESFQISMEYTDDDQKYHPEKIYLLCNATVELLLPIRSKVVKFFDLARDGGKCPDRNCKWIVAEGGLLLEHIDDDLLIPWS